MTITRNSRVFVLVHGAWHGGWCWRDVASRLRDAGHQVYTPTMTGLAERAHLLRADTGLSTCIEDICAVIEAGELRNVVLVGHSYAGVVISGVADRIAQHLDQLVYLDAVLVQHGQPALSAFPPEVQRQRSKTIDAEGLCIAIPEVSKFGVTEPAQAAWLQHRLTPHPLKMYTDPLLLQHPLGNGLRKTYVAVTDPYYMPLAQVRDWVCRQADWNYLEIVAGHDAMITSSEALTDLLCELSR